MVNSSLVGYIKKYKDQYDINTLRSFLIQQGYNPSDIEQAIRVVSSSPKKFPTKIVLGVVIAIFLLASIYFFWPSEKLELFLELSPEKTAIQKAENFVFSASLGTNQEKETEGKFYYTLFDDKKNKLIEGFDYVKLTKFKRMSFPLDTKNLIPGKYNLDFFFLLEGKETSDSFNFEVKPETSSTVISMPEITCPYSCNDNDPYTKDECVNNKCVNTPENTLAKVSINTCGNNVCDAQETTLNCSQDCAPEKVITSEDLSQKALQLAKSNPEEAANICLQLTVGYDECLKELNTQTNNSEFCNAVINSKIKDDCYSDHAIRIDDFNVCSLIVNSLKQRACFNLKKLE